MASMSAWVPWAVCAALALALLLAGAVGIVLLPRLLRRDADGGTAEAVEREARFMEQFDAVLDDVRGFRAESARTLERIERALRADVLETARLSRTEMSGAFAHFQQTVSTQLGSIATLQNQKVDAFAKDLTQLTQSNAAQLEASRTQITEHARLAREEQGAALRQFGDTLHRQLTGLSQSNDQRMSEVRATLEQKLKDIEVGNAAKLEEMRRTVDEKLNATLEQRLGASFKLVSERLELVHRGLGEMHKLADGVGDLKKVLTNVKTRGTWGEVQLGALLDQILTADQYAVNVATVPGSHDRVEFAIRLPGRSLGASAGAPGEFTTDGGGSGTAAAFALHDDGRAGRGVGTNGGDHGVVWLPIDAKFPREDYERLVDAQERADVQGVEEAARGLDSRVRQEARRIAEKYLSPPHTTDFGILYLPTEGLYAEVVRRPGLSDALQRDLRITIAGPTTLTALLNSLQMGFRTLAIERRSSEVWQVLGAVKTEFSKFGDVLAKTRSQLETVTRSIDMAERRSRVMHRALRDVEALPGDTAARALNQAPAEADE